MKEEQLELNEEQAILDEAVDEPDNIDRGYRPDDEPDIPDHEEPLEGGDEEDPPPAPEVDHWAGWAMADDFRKRFPNGPQSTEFQEWTQKRHEKPKAPEPSERERELARRERELNFERLLRDEIRQGKRPRLSEEEVKFYAQKAAILQERAEVERREDNRIEQMERELTLSRIKRQYQKAAKDAELSSFDADELIDWLDKGGVEMHPIFSPIVDMVGPTILDRPDAFLRLVKMETQTKRVEEEDDDEIEPEEKIRQQSVSRKVKSPRPSAPASPAKRADKPGFVDGMPIEEDIYDQWRSDFHNESEDYPEASITMPPDKFVRSWRKVLKGTKRSAR